MAMFQSAFATGKKNTPSSSTAGEEGIAVYEHTTTATMGSGDILEMGCIPAGATITDVVLVSDDLDSGTSTLRCDVGVMSSFYGDSTAGRTCGAEFFSADAITSTGGVARMTLPTGFRVAADRTKDRGIGIKIATAANVWANGKINLIVRYTYV